MATKSLHKLHLIKLSHRKINICHHNKEQEDNKEFLYHANNNCLDFNSTKVYNMNAPTTCFQLYDR